MDKEADMKIPSSEHLPVDQLIRLFTPHFGPIETETLSAIQDQLDVRHLAMGEVLFRQGDPGEEMYFIIQGRLELLKANLDGDGRLIGEACSGEMIGEFVLLAESGSSESQRSATVMAAEPTDVLVLSRSIFDDLLRQYPQIMLHMTRRIVQRSRRITQTVSTGEPGLSPRLVVTSSQGAVSYNLTLPRIRIGRSPDNDIVIDNQFVSRYHAELEQRGQDYFLVPSRNITNTLLLEEQPVMEPVRLQHGARIRIGGYVPGEVVSLEYLLTENVGRPVSQQTIQFVENRVTTIGRDKENAIVLPSPIVARFHAEVEKVGQRYHVRDLRSSNGTFINGRRVDGEAWAHPGDAIQIGPYWFKVGEDAFSQVDQSQTGMKVVAVGLNKWVNKKLNLLQNISLVFQPREFIVIVGRSGSGKTTLVDAIAGYRPATQGRVVVNDTIDVYRDFDAIRPMIGYVPQRDIIHMELTVYQALDYAAQLRMPPDPTAEERRQRVQEVMQELELDQRHDIPISHLSGGQQKRVSIGVELLTKPGLFFLDEPTSGLDPGMETDLMRLMRRLADQGRTIVMITHATKNVMLADKVVFLAHGGYLAWCGPPEEALAYFDANRSERDRRSSPMAFDNIYNLLDDAQLGSGKEWGERFMKAPAYQKYIAVPLQDKVQEDRPQVRQADAPARSSAPRRQVSGLRQFIILSSRSLRVLMQDRISLLLLLALAPVVGALNFIWGGTNFDPVKGSFSNVIQMWFMTAFIGMLVGTLGSVREIVKEADIYHRERTVGLKIMPYILSKVWVGVVVSIYQAAAYLLLVALIVRPVVPSILTYLPLLFTMALGILCGYLMGLAISALVPNQNSALILLIAVVAPQLFFAGVLLPLKNIPGGEIVSHVIPSRWTFEAFLRIPGTGDTLVNDACWALPADQRSALTDAQRAACPCMGENIFSSCTSIPGILSPDRWNAQSKAAMARPEPIRPLEPTLLPSPTPLATLTPLPLPSSPAQMPQYQAALQAQMALYMKGQIGQASAYTQAVQDQYKDYITQVGTYTTDEQDWQTQRQATIGSAERQLERIMDLYGPAFSGTVATRWWNLAAIVAGLLILIFVFQKLKDIVR